MLIEAKASVEARRNDGSTPLIVAAYFGHEEVVATLLAAKAKLTPSDADGTALANAKQQKKWAVVELLEKAGKERGFVEGEEEALIAPLEDEVED